MIDDTETKYSETENSEVKVFTLEDDAIDIIVRDARKQGIDLTGNLISVIVQLPENKMALGTGITPHDDDVVKSVDLDKLPVSLSSIQIKCALFLRGTGSSVHAVKVDSVTRSVLHNH